MVNRYKKAGGFNQLIQVMETCGSKKREQFMNIIREESPSWAEAIEQKSLTFPKIISWKPEVLLEIIASVNLLSFSTSIKGLNDAQMIEFLSKFSHQDKARLERSLLEINPSPMEVQSSQNKVISDTRGLINSGALKIDKIDPLLSIPDEFEAMLEKNQGIAPLSNSSSVDSANLSIPNVASIQSLNPADAEKIQKRIQALTKEVQVLKQENSILKDKLEKIKKIA